VKYIRDSGEGPYWYPLRKVYQRALRKKKLTEEGRGTYQGTPFRGPRGIFGTIPAGRENFNKNHDYLLEKGVLIRQGGKDIKQVELGPDGETRGGKEKGRDTYLVMGEHLSIPLSTRRTGESKPSQCSKGKRRY